MPSQVASPEPLFDSSTVYDSTAVNAISPQTYTAKNFPLEISYVKNNAQHLIDFESPEVQMSSQNSTYLNPNQSSVKEQNTDLDPVLDTFRSPFLSKPESEEKTIKEELSNLRQPLQTPHNFASPYSKQNYGELTSSVYIPTSESKMKKLVSIGSENPYTNRLRRQALLVTSSASLNSYENRLESLAREAENPYLTQAQKEKLTSEVRVLEQKISSVHQELLMAEAELKEANSLLDRPTSQDLDQANIFQLHPQDDSYNLGFL